MSTASRMRVPQQVAHGTACRCGYTESDTNPWMACRSPMGNIYLVADLYCIYEMTFIWFLKKSTIGSLASYPGHHVFQRCTPKIGRAWSIMSCNDDGWTQFRTRFEDLCPIAHTNISTYVHMYSTQLASQKSTADLELLAKGDRIKRTADKGLRRRPGIDLCLRRVSKLLFES